MSTNKTADKACAIPWHKIDESKELEEQIPTYATYILIATKQKYEWEEEWDERVEPAEWDEYHQNIRFLWDWNEGQEYHLLAWTHAGELPMPPEDL